MAEMLLTQQRSLTFLGLWSVHHHSSAGCLSCRHVPAQPPVPVVVGGCGSSSPGFAVCATRADDFVVLHGLVPFPPMQILRSFLTLF